MTIRQFDNFDYKNITGIRAPYLATNDAYFRAIKYAGYKYDSSLVYSKHCLNTPEEIPIRQIMCEQWNHRVVLPFDCNFEIIQIPGIGKKAAPEIREKIFFDSLCEDYINSPLPTQVCLHFQKVDGEPYFKAMQKFVEWVKDKNPKYMTYKEYSEKLK